MSSLFMFVILSSVCIEAVQSRYVFDRQLRRQVRHHKVVATWEEAREHCHSEGATLASPISEELLKYMQSVISAHNRTTPYFIGVRARRDGQVLFVSEEGIELEDVPATVDLIEQLDPGAGDCLCMDAHSIRAVPCWNRLPYMCYKNVSKEVVTTTESPTTTPTDCDTGYKLDTRTQSYYKVVNNNGAVTWDEANSTCSSDGGYLAILNNANEARVVGYNAFPVGEYVWAFVWIGLRDSTGNGGYLSVHGEPIANLFNDFEISNEKYDCVALRFDGKLESRLCFEHLPYVCEKNVLDAC